MNGSKHFFEFGTDLLLVSFLMVLMGVVFLSAINLTPGGADFSINKQVLGLNSEGNITGNGLQITPDFGSGDGISLNLQSQQDNELKLAFTTSDLTAGEHIKKLADLNDNNVKNKKIFFRLDLADKYLSDMRYDLEAGGNSYVIYDDAGERLTRDYVIDIEPGKSFEMLLKITAYKAPAYSINGVAGISDDPEKLP